MTVCQKCFCVSTMFMRYFTTKIPRPKTVYTNDCGVRAERSEVGRCIYHSAGQRQIERRRTHAGCLCCLAACVDVGLTLSERYSVDSVHRRRPTLGSSTTVGYVVHLVGAVAGLAAGFLVLRPSPTRALDRQRCPRRRTSDAV